MPSIANQINWLTTQINNLLDLGCGCGECEAQDNKYKVINFGSASSPFDTPVDVSTFINALPLNGTDYKTILEDEIPLFVGYVSYGRAKSVFNKYIVKGHGKGVYGTGGTITLTNDDLELIETEVIGGVSYPPIDNDPNAVVHDLGEIPSGDFLTVVNAGGPYVVTAGTNTYFEFTVGGDTQIWAFDGANGTYGSGGTTMLSTNVFLIYDETNTTTYTLDEVTTAGNTTENNIDIGRVLSFFDNDTETRDWDFFSDGDIVLRSNGNFKFNFSPLGILSMYNAAGHYASIRPVNLTASQEYELPDKSGTIALVEDVELYKPVKKLLIKIPVATGTTGSGFFNPLAPAYTNWGWTGNINFFWSDGTLTITSAGNEFNIINTHIQSTDGTVTSHSTSSIVIDAAHTVTTRTNHIVIEVY